MKKCLFLILFIFLLAGCTEGSITVEGKHNLLMDTSNHVSDYNYEPEETDLLQVVVSAFYQADHHDWGDFRKHFVGHKVNETDFAQAYGVYNHDPEDVEQFTYDIKNKQFHAYLEDVKVEPLKTYTKDGVEYAKFPYDVWIEFSFELTRHIQYEDKPTKSDTFFVEGTMPATWHEDINETHWRIQDLYIQRKDKEDDSND